MGFIFLLQLSQVLFSPLLFHLHPIPNLFNDFRFLAKTIDDLSLVNGVEDTHFWGTDHWVDSFLFFVVVREEFFFSEEFSFFKNLPSVGFVLFELPSKFWVGLLGTGLDPDLGLELPAFDKIYEFGCFALFVDIIIEFELFFVA